MSGPFDSIRIPASGMKVYKTWLEAISDNVANLNTVRSTSESAFQERLVVAESVAGEDGGVGKGARVEGVRFGDGEGRLYYQPTHPLADADGMVRYPDLDLSEQMTNMIVAQRAYQANITVFERARDAYERALQIGRG